MLLRGVLLVLTLGPIGSTAPWNLTTSIRILNFAQAAYCEGLADWDCGHVCRNLPQLSNVTVVADNATMGLAYVGTYAEEIVLSFRGTVATDFMNWWSDLKSLRLVPTPLCPADSCTVGDGFLDAYNVLRSRIWRAVNASAAGGAKRRLVVTGHSLGGALAHLAAVDYYQQRPVDVALDTVVTFGSPRTGNDVFGKYYARMVSDRAGYAWRVTHYRDPIVHMPPRTVFQAHHVPTELFLWNRSGTTDYRVCDGSGEDKNCSAGIVPWPTPRDHLDYLDTHLGSYHCPP